MSLFEKTLKKKKSTLDYYIVVEDVTEVEFNRLNRWVHCNISSTERYTPEWKPVDGFVQAMMTKVTFRFRYEDQAMAFKLIL